MANVANNMPSHPVGNNGGNETTAGSLRNGSAFYRRGGPSRQWPTNSPSRTVRGRGRPGSDSTGKNMRTIATGSDLRRRS